MSMTLQPERAVSRNGLTSGTNLALAALFLGAFVVGSAELVVVGVLNNIATDLRVSISTAGTLVSSYALGISIGGPVLNAVSIRFGRRVMLWLSLATYTLGNVVAVTAVNFGMLVAARVITGALHGLFIGVAFAVAAALVTPQRMGRAISIVFGGIAVSTALGVPLGTLIGQEFGWRATFTALVILGVATLVIAVLFIPAVPNNGVAGFTAQARHALAPRVLALLGVGFLLLGGQFATLTYLTVFLLDVTHISTGVISIFLLAYGIANAIGTFAGGWAADRSATKTLVTANVLLVIALGMLYLAGSIPILVTIALALWGLVGFGLVPSLQYRIVNLAGRGRDFAATLPASAVTLGIATGAIIGGRAVANHGPSGAVAAGLIISAAALPAVVATSWLKTPTYPHAEPDTNPAPPPKRNPTTTTTNDTSPQPTTTRSQPTTQNTTTTE
jgi:DHA1 family inner membrane transport protein